MSDALDRSLAKSLAPTGTLRAAINVGNSVLAQRTVAVADARAGAGVGGGAGATADGTPKGVAVDIARALAQSLGLPLEIEVYESAREVVEACGQHRWDISFMAADPKRRAEILFTPPYVLIEGHFVVRRDSPNRCSADLNRPDVRLALGAGTAYELYLSRHYQAAQIDRFPTTAVAFERFLEFGHDATAGVKEVAQAFVNREPGLELLPDPFMIIEQTVAIPSTHGAAAAYVTAFVEELKRSGFIAESLRKSGQTAAVAPCC
jgi:polar amino acid transport system substrate-binding protein